MCSVAVGETEPLDEHVRVLVQDRLQVAGECVRENAPPVRSRGRVSGRAPSPPAC